MNIGIREMKNRLSHYLRKVKLGDTIIITERNVPIAKLVPFMKKDMEEILHLQELGILKWNGGKPTGLKKPLQLKSNKLVSDIISEDRR